MANFTHKMYTEMDDYMTPFYVWDNIKQYIKTDLTIWEPFYGDGTSGQHLRDLGFNVIHEPINFFTNNLGDIIVSNPPFSIIQPILRRLFEIDKPFILILPNSKINMRWMREWKDKHLQLIIPAKRIHFIKYVNGSTDTSKYSSCCFDCFYYCYKLDLPSDLNWL